MAFNFRYLKLVSEFYMRLLNAIAAFLFVASFALASPTPNALPWAESGKVTDLKHY